MLHETLRGRMSWEFLEGAVFTLAEMKRWEEARSAVLSFDRAFAQGGLPTRYYLAWIDWRATGKFREELPTDRNLIDFYADGGLTFTGMIPGRADDALAVGFAYTNISNRVSAADVDFGEPVARNYEALIEVCYTYQINPGWSVQPNFQYIFQPGGNVAGVDDATVVGARTSISF